MNEIILKEATINDAAIIALLGRVTFCQTFEHLFTDKNDLLTYLDSTFSVQKIRKSLQKNNNIFWILYVNELPVGYSKLKLSSSSPHIIDKNTSQLQKIYILKGFLTLGLGKKMIDTLINRAKQSGSDCIWLAVLHTNEKAINFYIKNNFSKIGNHFLKIGKDNFYFNVLCKYLN